MDQPIESILVPTDGSESASRAASRAIDLAATLGADLHALSVVDVREVEPSLALPESTNPEKLEEIYVEDAEAAVESTAERAAGQLSTRVTTSVEWGIPFRAITGYVEDKDVDLVVMGTHGRTGLDRVLLGSVAEKTLRASSVPVLLVPKDAHSKAIREESYENILLPTDGSEGSEKAIDLAVFLGSVYGATIHTVYGIDSDRLSNDVAKSEILGGLEDFGRDAVEKVRKRARTAGVSVAGTVGSGAPEELILEYTSNHGIDLIVMGTHGRSGIERYLIGSTTEEVVRHADVPVCGVPLTEF
ncbi:universal stress protein [Natronomonas salina]|uniref:universal stress protein n=1 Tax=Natronomonas salina TaxID=1710540 RepID=UPI0015B3C7E0|nr:universal stress protein [Natronomonas salina]QLD89584.1 universal stress protein [Natronomonas salina]